MKITVISFDFWKYDGHIVDELRSQGVDAYHINLGAYQHKHLGVRLVNAFSKLFLKRNRKNERRQQLILEGLKLRGKQDQILVINPESIEIGTHKVIRTYTDRNIAYLYDSMSRYPADHLLHFFDAVFSFDKEDVKKYGFQKITNYNYLTYSPGSKSDLPFDLVFLTSFDKTRLQRLQKILVHVQMLKLKFKAVIAGKKSWKKKLLSFTRADAKYLYFRRTAISRSDMISLYKQSKAVLDLQRDHQAGLSFRVFEAMALEKKIITDNVLIQEYDFYTPNNILVLNSDYSNFTAEFFESPYEKIPADVYEKYTVESWVKRVFKL